MKTPMRSLAAGAILSALLSGHGMAHCPGVPPTVEMTFPKEGLAVQKACYASFGTCIIDTLFQEKLFTEMVEKYRASRYVVFGFLDSLRNYEVADTVWQSATEFYVDTLQEESLWLTVEGQLKDTLPEAHLFFKDRWQSIPELPFATTYTGLIDTPFIAFFDSFPTIRDMGLGPVDGCFFEPAAYLIIGNRIHKKGVEGDRMPGVSVPISTFLEAVGMAGKAVPQARAKVIGILRRSGLSPVSGTGHGPDSRFDAKGRRMGARPKAPGSRPRPFPAREYP